ncbi:hypothetical protein ABTZ78_17240 [Streptomyces bauhiniae]|uniref:hypothetical protein n=1 Tax=Streptomyces bauhiniae TaxID=2340725 RepID=UPI00331D8138
MAVRRLLVDSDAMVTVGWALFVVTVGAACSGHVGAAWCSAAASGGLFLVGEVAGRCG